MRRKREQQPRAYSLTVKLSAAEKAAIGSAAAMRHLSVAAHVADVALAAAEGRAVPAGDTERELLGELIGIYTLLSMCCTRLTEISERLEATGVPGPDLEPVAARGKEAFDRAVDAAGRLSRTLRRRARLCQRPRPEKEQNPRKDALRISWFHPAGRNLAPVSRPLAASHTPRTRPCTTPAWGMRRPRSRGAGRAGRWSRR